MLDIDQIRQLVETMVTNDLVELSVRDGDVEVSLRRPTAAAGEVDRVPSGRQAQAAIVTAELGGPADAASPTAEDDGKLTAIPSPMVGTFYAALSPDSPPFVEVGSEVNADTVVCIIEAMKVFNEIRAEVVGAVERVLVNNEQAVEYGQTLYLVRPQ